MRSGCVFQSIPIFLLFQYLSLLAFFLTIDMTFFSNVAPALASSFIIICGTQSSQYLFLLLSIFLFPFHFYVARPRLRNVILQIYSHITRDLTISGLSSGRKGFSFTYLANFSGTDITVKDTKPDLIKKLICLLSFFLVSLYPQDLINFLHFSVRTIQRQIFPQQLLV